MKKLNLDGFQSLSREELRNTLGGAYDCMSDCSMNSHCACDGDYCGSLVCSPRPGYYTIRKTCVYSGNGNNQN